MLAHLYRVVHIGDRARPAVHTLREHLAQVFRRTWRREEHRRHAVLLSDAFNRAIEATLSAPTCTLGHDDAPFERSLHQVRATFNGAAALAALVTVTAH